MNCKAAQETEKKYIIALDQGTTSSRCIVFDSDFKIIGVAQREIRQYYPKDGWVEEDPMEIYSSQYGVMEEVLIKNRIRPEEIAAIGITNQRETTIVWDKNTGRPVCNAIVWQCRRTGPICDRIKGTPMEKYIRENTGLVVDAYFSAAKVKWILENVPGAREKAKRGELLFGTVDTWLVWNLTGGKVHKTDRTNASRTMLYNIKTHSWDENLLDYFGIPKEMLPEVQSSGDDYGYVNVSGKEIPIRAVCGDQQSSLFGIGCHKPGDVKNTYGTGCFLLVNTGDEMILSENGLVTTVTAGLKGKSGYAVEGSIFIGGSVVQWLRDEMNFIKTAHEADIIAENTPDSGGIYVVPAFTGLGAPYWDMYARGLITGITRSTKPAHIIRASLEAIAYQTYDVLETFKKDIPYDFNSIRVDGGASASDFLMQFQADITGVNVERPVIRESTALGAAALAGLSCGMFDDPSEITDKLRTDRIFTPEMDRSEAEERIKGWKEAVGRTLTKLQ